jgi:hypothetical protein
MLSTLAAVNASIFGRKEESNDSNIIMAADEITLAEFREKLGKYPALIASHSKPGMFALGFSNKS